MKYVAIVPLSAEDDAALVAAAGGPALVPDRSRYLAARLPNGWLVSVRHSDVLEAKDVQGIVGGSAFDY